MTNGSQPSGGFEPPRHPGNTNNLDPRLVEKMEKMRHELQACRSLKEEIRGQQQSLSGQGKHPAPTPTQNQCQPASVKVRASSNATATKHANAFIKQAVSFYQHQNGAGPINTIRAGRLQQGTNGPMRRIIPGKAPRSSPNRSL